MLANDLYTYVLEMLSGKHESCKRIHLFQKPSKQFIIGSLADTSKNYAVAEGIGENKVQAKSALRHNSMGLMFLLNKKKIGSLDIKTSCSIFYRIFPTFEEQLDYFNKIKDDESVKKDPGFKEIHIRKDIAFDSFKFSLVNDKETEFLDFSSVRAEIIEENKAFRGSKDIKNDLEIKKIRGDFDPDWISDEKSYSEIISKLKKTPSKKTFQWKAEIVIDKEDYNSGFFLITVWLKNITESRNFEQFIFNCDLIIDLDSNELVPFEYNYKYEENSYVQKGNIRPINCHAEFNPTSNIIVTTPYALFEQQRKAPRISINGIVPKFTELKNSINILKQLLEELNQQYSRYINHPIYNDVSHVYNSQFLKETEQFRLLVERYKSGVEIIESNSRARNAFFLMNQVFEDAMKGLYEGWRIFQIIFIVMLIPDIIDVKKNRDKADIIHVDTGGGKSEAYFGVVVFLLFWDRLRGKDMGVSAITKFPLRMLSIQQLQRIAKIIVIAEDLRKTKGIEGDPFSVGYYVGVSDEFPRHTRHIIDKIQKAEEKGSTVPGMLLDKCPTCENDIVLKIDSTSDGVAFRILHWCETCKKEFFLYFSNSEIYRLLPSFIVSTVDKLAAVALNRRFKNLMGGKLSMCSSGHKFNPIGDKCDFEVNIKRSCEGDPIPFNKHIEGPTLMIQDEMHLIREGFGTINSHFEGLLNTLLQRLNSGKEFKYISMTATVSGVKEQIDHLYGKEFFIFPGNLPRGLKKDKDFFFEYEKKKNGDPKIQRILIGLKPNLRDNQFASLLTIYHIASFLEILRSNKKSYATKYKITEKDLEKEIRKYQCLLTYHGKKADVFGMDYFIHTVVTSKLEGSDVKNQTLTGYNTLDEIKNTISQIQSFPEEKENENKIHATFATSVVSHGVDIDNWNLMIFQGMTRNTSEYIQALSRVGRRYLGIIFLWFYPNRVRDLSYYKNFPLFHDILQQKVEKTPISRWTKLGFKQTFTSIFCGAILNYISNEIGGPLYTVDGVNNHFDDIPNREKLFKFIEDAYYSKMDRIGAKWFRDNIRGETEERLNCLKKYKGSIFKNFFPNALKDSKNPYFKTQYGMRGIQEEIVLRLNENFNEFINKFQRGED